MPQFVHYFIVYFILVTNSKGSDYDDLDFRVVVDSKSGPPLVISLVAPTLQDKAAWTSDISQVRSTGEKYQSINQIYEKRKM